MRSVSTTTGAAGSVGSAGADTARWWISTSKRMLRFIEEIAPTTARLPRMVGRPMLAHQTSSLSRSAALAVEPDIRASKNVRTTTSGSVRVLVAAIAQR